jgi:DNA-binding NarL/FixJ family response regulator
LPTKPKHATPKKAIPLLQLFNYLYPLMQAIAKYLTKNIYPVTCCKPDKLVSRQKNGPFKTIALCGTNFTLKQLLHISTHTYRCLLAFCFFFLPASSNAQVLHTWADSIPSIKITAPAVLPDKGYTFKEMLAGTTPAFAIQDSLKIRDADFFWIKLIIDNPGEYDVPVTLEPYPYLYNTLFYFDYNQKQWNENKAGIFVKQDDQRVAGTMWGILKGATQNVFYIKAGVKELRNTMDIIKPQILIRPAATTQHEERIYWEGWIAALVVLLFFFLNNLYVYFGFKDKAALYYLPVQLGGMIYITSYKEFFHTLFPGQAFTIKSVSPGLIDYYDWNYLLQHVAIVLVIYGFVQLTRSYLNTRKFMPRLDQVLKYGLYFYILASAILMLINSCFFYIENSTLTWDNCYLLLLISVVLFTCVLGYKRKLRAAGSFLWANMLPLLAIVGTTLLHITTGFNNNYTIILPYLAIATQALGISIALVVRIRQIQQDLNEKELEAMELEFDINSIIQQRETLLEENEKIDVEMKAKKIQNETLQQRLEANQREMAASSLYIAQKNEMLATLKAEMTELKNLHPAKENRQLKTMESLLNSSQFLDDDWAKFRLHFEQVHPHFFEELEAKHPSLTNNELRLYSYFHMKLTTKEIALLLNIEPASVRRAKTRLLKKMKPNNHELID